MKLLIGIILSVVSGGFALEDIPDFICDGVETNTYVEDVTDCTGWIRCVDEKPVGSGYCKSPYFFEKVKQVCTHEDSVECFKCPPGIVFLPVSNSCSRLIRCVVGVPTEMQCDEGLWFDPDAGRCSDEECKIPEMICPTNLEPGKYTAQNHPTNCSIGFVCFGEEEPTEISCNQNLHFNATTLMCVLPERSKCTVTETCCTTKLTTTTTTTTRDPNIPGIETRRFFQYIKKFLGND